jgi:hypothetical protein
MRTASHPTLPPQKLELWSLDPERFTQAVKREPSIQNRPQFLLPLLPAQRGWGANNALQRTASPLGAEGFGNSTAADCPRGSAPAKRRRRFLQVEVETWRQSAPVCPAPPRRPCGRAGARPVAPLQSPPATPCAPAGGSRRTAPACSFSLPAGAVSRRRSLSFGLLGDSTRVH